MPSALYRTILVAQASARKELQHQAIDLAGVLVRGPVAGPRDAAQVERADGSADLADQQVGGSERRIVALAPEQPNPTAELSEVAQERTAAAHLAAVEAGSSDARGLDVYRLLADARRVAEHVDEQVVTADLAEALLVVPGVPVAAGRPLAEASRGEAAGGDQAQVRHPWTEPPGEVRGDRAAEREPGEPQRTVTREHPDEQVVHQVEIRRARRLARHLRRVAVRGVIERVHGEARGQWLDVSDPVLPGAHAAVKEDDVRSAPAAVHGHPRGRVGGQIRALRDQASRGRTRSAKTAICSSSSRPSAARNSRTRCSTPQSASSAS